MPYLFLTAQSQLTRLTKSTQQPCLSTCLHTLGTQLSLWLHLLMQLPQDQTLWPLVAVPQKFKYSRAIRATRVYTLFQLRLQKQTQDLRIPKALLCLLHAYQQYRLRLHWVTSYTLSLIQLLHAHLATAWHLQLAPTSSCLQWLSVMVLRFQLRLLTMLQIFRSKLQTTQWLTYTRYKWLRPTQKLV